MSRALADDTWGHQFGSVEPPHEIREEKDPDYHVVSGISQAHLPGCPIGEIEENNVAQYGICDVGLKNGSVEPFSSC